MAAERAAAAAAAAAAGAPKPKVSLKGALFDGALSDGEYGAYGEAAPKAQAGELGEAPKGVGAAGAAATVRGGPRVELPNGERAGESCAAAAAAGALGGCGSCGGLCRKKSTSAERLGFVLHAFRRCSIGVSPFGPSNPTVISPRSLPSAGRGAGAGAAPKLPSSAGAPKTAA